MFTISFISYCLDIVYIFVVYKLVFYEINFVL